MATLGRASGCVAVVAWVAAGCVHLDRSDAFPVAAAPVDAALIAGLAADGASVQPLAVRVAGRPIAAYYARHPAARGTAIFCGGSGNELGIWLQMLTPRMRAVGLDLVVFGYYERGEPVPAVADVRAAVRAVYAAVQADAGAAARPIYVVGHSLGAWFAIDLAASRPVAGLIIVGGETTAAEVIDAEYFPLSLMFAVRSDADQQQLDAGRYAPHVTVPALVVSSDADEQVPSWISHEVYDAIPATTRKRFVELHGVAHGAYFTRPELWRELAAFFALDPVPGPAPARAGQLPPPPVR